VALFQSGRAEEALVSHVDLFPTICELANLPPPAWLEGESLVPLLRGGKPEIRDAVFAEVTYHAAYEPMRAVRTRRWKYIRRWEERSSPVLPNCDDSPSKTWLLEHGWRDRAPARESLFDLAFDPNEACNLAGRVDREPVLKEMRGRLEQWMRDTHDPLLAGAVPAPKGAEINDPDGLSPQEKTRVVV